MSGGWHSALAALDVRPNQALQFIEPAAETLEAGLDALEAAVDLVEASRGVPGRWHKAGRYSVHAASRRAVRLRRQRSQRLPRVQAAYRARRAGRARQVAARPRLDGRAARRSSGARATSTSGAYLDRLHERHPGGRRAVRALRERHRSVPRGRAARRSRRCAAARTIIYQATFFDGAVHRARRLPAPRREPSRSWALKLRGHRHQARPHGASRTISCSSATTASTSNGCRAGCRSSATSCFGNGDEAALPSARLHGVLSPSQDRVSGTLPTTALRRRERAGEYPLRSVKHCSDLSVERCCTQRRATTIT